MARSSNATFIASILRAERSDTRPRNISRDNHAIEIGNTALNLCDLILGQLRRVAMIQIIHQRARSGILIGVREVFQKTNGLFKKRGHTLNLA